MSVNVSVNSPDLNLTVNVNGKESQVLNVFLSTKDAQLVLQEVYFDSSELSSSVFFFCCCFLSANYADAKVNQTAQNLE